MKGLYAGIWAETLKVRRSKIFRITLMAFSAIGILMGLMVLVTKYPALVGQSTIASAKSALFKDDWHSYFEILLQIILGFGIIGFGMVSSWVFGREYVDRTETDLLSLPIHRSTIVMSKFIIIIIWCLLLALTLFVVGILTGMAVNITGWSFETTYHYFIVFIESSILTILVCTPVAFIASFSRGYLAPIGYVIATLFITNIIPISIPSIIPYIPWAIPALGTGLLGPNFSYPGIISYIILFSTCIFGIIGTVAWWRFADQN
ncbi:ABC transporter permease [uncultured Methanobacterium sp.]|uniref:ABC transporter permease n=1 Tax=uncultured Methanobacterium sp. TaxID=176306 RepID=UPI002AA625C6|nr:ABC transporter permease [uncultured Methanobacterium sp.]